MNLIPRRRHAVLEGAKPDLEDLWARVFGTGSGDLLSHLPELFQRGPIPPVNVSETEDAICVSMDCPGLNEEDFDVQVMGRQLVISGERKWEQERQERDFRRVESQFGAFERSVELPENATADACAIQATYEKGILSITVPKLERTPSAKIPVRVGR
jgi:HSP20 family protein